MKREDVVMNVIISMYLLRGYLLWNCCEEEKEGEAMSRIRTIEKAFEEIRRADPDTCITKHFIKNLIINGEIPHRKTGNRYLIDVDEVIRYTQGEREM